LIVRGCDREEAIRKMRSALSELVVTGIDINADLHLKILREKDFIVATYGTDFFKKFKEKSQK
jgi:acetyl-CoA carboxylase biotin carboxylase subunit